MPKGPRVHRDIERYVVELVTDNPLLNAKAIEVALVERFKGTDIPIPALRTIQERAKRVVDYLTIQEEPWSLAVMARGDTDIPWEAAGFLLWALSELQRLQNGGEEIWHWSEHPLDDLYYEGSMEEVVESLRSGREPEHVSVKPLAPRAPVGTILTNRQAKWLARLHLMFRRLKPTDLFHRADVCARQELLADYLGWDFDTSNIEASLSNLARHIGVHGYYPDREQPNEAGGEG
jgi:hypothetical protein